MKKLFILAIIILAMIHMLQAQKGANFKYYSSLKNQSLTLSMQIYEGKNAIGLIGENTVINDLQARSINIGYGRIITIYKELKVIPAVYVGMSAKGYEGTKMSGAIEANFKYKYFLIGYMKSRFNDYLVVGLNLKL